MNDLFDSATIQNELLVLARVAGAMLLGALIGTEREVAQRPAGLRTHMLVSGASALLTSLGLGLVTSFDAQTGGDVLRADPIRVIEAIVTGIAFLGAGTILRSGPDDITGLTTAASLLLSASIGISAALSRWVLAVGIVVLALATLFLVRHLERPLGKKSGGPESQTDD